MSMSILAWDKNKICQKTIGKIYFMFLRWFSNEFTRCWIIHSRVVVSFVVELLLLLLLIFNLFLVDQINKIHNHSIYVKIIAIIEDKC